MDKRLPHLIFFNPDQWRGDVLGHMGNSAARTPCLDDLVTGEAVSFRHAFCQNPVCTPSRCSFMTGRYPHVAGHRTMHHMLHPEHGESCLLAELTKAGYDVWWGGKNDLLPGTVDPVAAGICTTRYRWENDPRTRAPGYQQNLHSTWDWRPEVGAPGYYSMYAGQLGAESGDAYADQDWCVVKAAIDYLEARDPDRPLCLFLALQYPHPPYGVEEPYFSAIDRDRIPPCVRPEEGPQPAFLDPLRERQGLGGWTEAQWQELRAVYYGMCMRVDAQLACLLEAVKRAGMYEDTALFFFSDHGDYTGDYGLVEKAQNHFPDCLTRVPLVVKPPATTTCQPRVADALVELVDISATVYDMTGLQPDYAHNGRSLMPLLTGEALGHRDAVFCEGGRLMAEAHCMEGKSGDTASLYWPRTSLQMDNSGPWHGKAVMCRTRDYKLVYRLYESDEFYDLRVDPEERHNRIEDAGYAETIIALRDRIIEWFTETADVVPLCQDAR